MKKTLLLTMALGLAGAASLQAGTVEVFLTGSTAFRANVYAASTKLFAGSTPAIYYGDAAHGGADSGFSSGTASWVMTGTPATSVTNLYSPGVPSGTTLIVHGLFTGSIQGIATVEASTPLVFPKAQGIANGLCSDYVTNIPTVGFSDASGASAPYPAVGDYVEENVCVQPFVIAKSGKPPIGAVTNISNVSWEQLEYGIPAGRIPLSAWTYNAADTNTFIYLLQRTKDSGTRRCETASMYYDYNDNVGIYLYDYTNAFWYTPTTLANNTFGSSPNGVVGSAGLGGANLTWGYGYVAGGDIKNSLNDLNNGGTANQAIAMLSMGDSKGVGSANWANVVSFNGFWPTVAGAGIHGNTVTNDYSPIINGYYPLWGNETLVYSTAQSGLSGVTGAKITDSQLWGGGSYNQAGAPGSFMGVFNGQNAANPIVGSIDNEIFRSENNVTGVADGTYPATAIRLSEMKCNRASVGGIIAPF